MRSGLDGPPEGLVRLYTRCIVRVCACVCVCFLKAPSIWWGLKSLLSFNYYPGFVVVQNVSETFPSPVNTIFAEKKKYLVQ